MRRRARIFQNIGLPLCRWLALNELVPASQSLLFSDPRPLVERLGPDFFRQLTKRPGVYLMHDAADRVVYVGKAKNLRQRLGSYRVANPDRLGRRHLRLLRQVLRIEVEECADEAAALAREAELLLALKPKFNRAGVWPATPRYLCWRPTGGQWEFALAESPGTGWQGFGPAGSGLVYLRAALVRLVWLAHNPAAGSLAMPAGWVHGRLGNSVMVTMAKDESGADKTELVLKELSDGNPDPLVAWVSVQTQLLTNAYDQALRDADLDTVMQFIRAKARRLRPFVISPLPPKERPRETAWLFALEKGAGP